MATEKKIWVFEQITKTVKGTAQTVLQKVKTNGTLADAQKAIEKLQKNGVQYFELSDEIKGIKSIYNRTLSGRNYEIKQIKI